jgi:hypothetical protein
MIVHLYNHEKINKKIKAVLNALTFSNGNGALLYLEDDELKVMPISATDLESAKESSGDFKKRLDYTHQKITEHQAESVTLDTARFTYAIESIDAGSVSNEVMMLTNNVRNDLLKIVGSAFFILGQGNQGTGANTQNRVMAPVPRALYHDGRSKITDAICLSEAAALVTDVHTVLLEGMHHQDLDRIWKARAERLTSIYDIEIHNDSCPSQSQ